MVTMWKIPASTAFKQYLSIMGFTNTVPHSEHVYLGRQLTASPSTTLATKCQVNENDVRLMFLVVLEGREFRYNFDESMWYVVAEG